MKPRRRVLSPDQRLLVQALAVGFPGAAVALLLLWLGDFTPRVQWTLTALVLVSWLGLAFALRERVVRHFQTFSNLLAALVEGDYSLRARDADSEDSIGLAMLEANTLGETLRSQRLRALEATALLRKVMDEIEVSIFAIDEGGQVRLVNRAGERLLARPAERILLAEARDLGLAPLLEGEPARTLEASFPGGRGRWEVRRSDFREGGKPHLLLVVSDLSRALREEELEAWKRLVRVLGHEINNSLTPIQSLADSLQDLLARRPPDPEREADLERGLKVIRGRAEALGRFMTSYARLARLPPPRLAPLEVAPWVRRVAALEKRRAVRVDAGPEMSIRADSDQLDQLLINLLRNAVDAAEETGGGAWVGWRRDGARLEVRVEDEGPGLSDTPNLFVPFFTTKPEGSGIGLVLSRQIAEAHAGTLHLENRPEGRGCRAVLRLPV
jgi:nitrogen fixation/metabolism regulation signal transduction histidine kinase